MSTKLKKLQEDGLGFAKTAREIVEKAQLENRPMNEDEQVDYKAAMEKGQRVLEDIKVAKADEKVLDDAKALAAEIGPLAVDDIEAQKSDQPDIKQRVRSLGLQVVESAQFKSLMASFGGRIPDNSRVHSDPIEVKNLMAPAKALFTGLSDTSAGAFVVADQSGIVETLGRRELTLRQLISVRRTGSDTVEYVTQTSHTNNAAPTAEATTSAAPTIVNTEGTPNVSVVTKAAGGGYKPEGAWAYARATATVKTIAEWVPASKRALADVGQLEGLINDELRADIAEAEETEIVSGSGSGEHLLGIMNAGIQTQSFSTDLFISVRKGLTKARKVGRVRPNGIVMAPEDVEVVDLAQDANDRYYGNGPFSMGPRTLWGIPIVESEAITAGHALLGDFSKAVLWDREQTTVTMTDSHEDFFVRNLVAILAEERVAFAVTRPTAFVDVDVAA